MPPPPPRVKYEMKIYIGFDFKSIDFSSWKWVVYVQCFRLLLLLLGWFVCSVFLQLNWGFSSLSCCLAFSTFVFPLFVFFLYSFFGVRYQLPTVSNSTMKHSTKTIVVFYFISFLKLKESHQILVHIIFTHNNTWIWAGAKNCDSESEKDGICIERYNLLILWMKIRIKCLQEPPHNILHHFTIFSW